MSDKSLRRYSRVDLLSKIGGQLQVVAALGGVHQSKDAHKFFVKDFSKSGAGIFTNTLLPKHGFVLLNFDGLNKRPLEGRIMWSGPATAKDEPPESMQYRIGIDFMPKDDDARENQLEIYAFMARLADDITKK